MQDHRATFEEASRGDLEVDLVVASGDKVVDRDVDKVDIDVLSDGR